MTMTIDEAKRCIKDDVFPALPDVADWMVHKSPQPEKTLELWAKALTRLERDEVERVIGLWFNGSVDAPKAYERELIPQCIISNAMRLRADANMRASVIKTRREHEEHRTTPNVINAVKSNKLWPNWLRRHAAVQLGEMTESDALREWNKELDFEFAAGRVKFTL